MRKKFEPLLSQLIGLARATDGSEHLITPASTAVVLECLRAMAAGNGDVDALLQKVLQAKRAMVPNCFSCANPCGRTESYDLSRLEQAEETVRRLKWELLDGLCRLAAEKPDTDPVLFYRLLTVLGLEDYTHDDLRQLMEQLEKI